MRLKWIQEISLALFFSLVMVVGVFAQDNVTTTSGVINNDTPFVEYPLTIDAPADVVIDIQSTSGTLDTLLYLVDDLGNIVDENDDREEGIYDSLIAYNGLPAGSYSIVATRFDITYGDSEGDFTLAVDVRPAADRTLPDYPTDAAALVAPRALKPELLLALVPPPPAGGGDSGGSFDRRTAPSVPSTAAG